MENRNDIEPIDSQPIVNSKPTPPQKEKLFSIILVGEVIIGAILITIFIFNYFFNQPPKKKTIDTTANTPSPVVTNSTTTQPTDKPADQTTSPYKITWLDKPQKINSMSIFKSNEHQDINGGYRFKWSEAEYYLVGQLGDKSQLIYLYLPENAPGEYNVLFSLVKTPEGNISILDSENIKGVNENLLSNITIATYKLDKDNPPESIFFNDISFKKFNTRNQPFNSLVNPKLIKSFENGNLYVVYSSNSDSSSRQFYYVLKNWEVYVYNHDHGLLTDNSTVNFNWLDGSTTSDQFIQDSHSSCGMSSKGPNIIRNSSSELTSKVQVGNFNNHPIYQIKNQKSAFVKGLYETYKSGRDPNTMDIISYDEFINIKNHFIYQDSFGDWLIFVNQKYGSMAECGKPVIYLYPVKDTQVKVQVGAQITVSEPVYPEGGWLVTAKPNGELTYQNQNYPYLFWEGLGNGLYPDYRNRGTVVSQKDLIPTLYKQLSQLGLNQKESADFMEFWQPKLPSSPYVRLTWLNTKDMDTLAPLAVTPRPDTSIRIFLEFQGLDQPIKLIPQTLSAPARKGFTLIEWGGLLLKGRE